MVKAVGQIKAILKDTHTHLKSFFQSDFGQRLASACHIHRLPEKGEKRITFIKLAMIVPPLQIVRYTIFENIKQTSEPRDKHLIINTLWDTVDVAAQEESIRKLFKKVIKGGT